MLFQYIYFAHQVMADSIHVQDEQLIYSICISTTSHDKHGSQKKKHFPIIFLVFNPSLR